MEELSHLGWEVRTLQAESLSDCSPRPEKVLSMAELHEMLAAAIGPPDYGDEGLIQYLRTERVIPPYQTRGYKLVELVRIYETGGQPYRGQ